MTTTTTLTDDQIIRLRNEAATAGDLVAVAVCELALWDEIGADVALDEADALKLERLGLDSGPLSRQEQARRWALDVIQDQEAQ